jgi:hypothetical protein
MTVNSVGLREADQRAQHQRCRQAADTESANRDGNSLPDQRRELGVGIRDGG